MKTIKQLILDERRANDAANARTLIELGRLGYINWRPSAAVPTAGTVEHRSGYKVTLDFETAEWMWWRGRRDLSQEGRGIPSLFHWLSNAGRRD